MKELADALKESPSLERLHLGKCNLRDADVENIAQVLPDMPNLQKLILNGNDGITDKGGRALLDALRRLPDTNKIIHIGIYSTSISVKVGRAILKAISVRGKAYAARRKLALIRIQEEQSLAKLPAPQRRNGSESQTEDLSPEQPAFKRMHTDKTQEESPCPYPTIPQLPQKAMYRLYILAQVATEILESENRGTTKNVAGEGDSAP